MNGYELSRDIFNYAFEHHECGVYHVSIYLWIVELNNRMGWKEEFGVPSNDTCEGLSIGNKHTYLNALRDLETWGFIRIIKESKNQFSATIVTLCRVKKDTAQYTALDTALTQHSTQHGHITVHATDTIDKQLNKETKKQGNKETTVGDFEAFYSLYPKKVNKKEARKKYELALKNKTKPEEIIEGLKRYLKTLERDKTELKFVKAPDSWIHNEKWNDEAPEENIVSDLDRRFEEGKRLLALSQN